MNAIKQIATSFPYQSYFDSVKLQAAILPPPVGQPLINPNATDGTFYGVGLHPSSSVPVAVRIYGDNGSVVVLTPGQKFHLNGAKRLEWGLPVGWLGGGNALLYITESPDVVVDFGPGVSSRMLFQRVRVPVEAAVGAVRKNWPGTSPWANAVSDALPLGGGPVLSVEPDICLARCLRPITGAEGPQTLTLVWRGVDDFDTSSAGVLGTTVQTSFDFTIQVSPDGTSLPVVWLPPEAHKLTSSAGGLAILDPANVIAASGAQAFVDFCRYVRVS